MFFKENTTILMQPILNNLTGLLSFMSVGGTSLVVYNGSVFPTALPGYYINYCFAIKLRIHVLVSFCLPYQKMIVNKKEVQTIFNTLSIFPSLLHYYFFERLIALLLIC